MTREESILNQLKKWTNQSAGHSLNAKEVVNNQSLQEFINSITATLTNLQNYIDKKDIQSFYGQIEELKYLIEYSDELNKNWYLIRAYSGALRRLLKERSIENVMSIYRYYEQTYGGRRILRDENWFEQNRWEFIDELKSIDSPEKLDLFLEKRIKKLNGYFQGYKSELLIFIQELQK